MLETTDLTMSTLLTTPVCCICRHSWLHRHWQTVDVKRVAADGTVDEFLTNQNLHSSAVMTFDLISKVVRTFTKTK